MFAKPSQQDYARFEQVLYKKNIPELMRTLAAISHVEPKFEIDPIRLNQLVLLKGLSSRDLYEKTMTATFFPTPVSRDIPLSFVEFIQSLWDTNGKQTIGGDLPLGTWLENHIGTSRFSSDVP